MRIPRPLAVACALGICALGDQNGKFAGDPGGCTDAGLTALADAKPLGLVSSIGFGVGAAGVVTAAVLLLTEPRRAASARRGVKAGVLSAGREGVTVGFKGAW